MMWGTKGTRGRIAWHIEDLGNFYVGFEVLQAATMKSVFSGFSAARAEAIYNEERL
jgi:hypothetical protein